MSFLERLEQTRLYAEATRLNILVWGSGKSSEHFEKRKKIREELTTRFVNAEVHFSEDPELLEKLKRAAISPESLTIPEQELWHLDTCDVCVALDTSEGVGEEIAHFVNSPLSYKLVILTNSKYRDSAGFPAMLRDKKNQIFYDDAEYVSCNLVERVSARVRQAALGKMTGLKA